MTIGFEIPAITSNQDFKVAQADLTAEFAVKMLGAELTSDKLGSGYIKSCVGDTMTNAYFVVAFESGETKNFLASTIASVGFLKFADELVADVYDSFFALHYEMTHQLFAVLEETRRREKEAQKLEKKRKENEKKMANMKVQAEKEFDKLASRTEKITKKDEFYYALGWVAKHVGTITAKMPDYLEPAFTKHFGDVEHTTVDSTKVGPSGFTSQWHLSMEASLRKAENIPAMLNDYLSQNGKKISKTSFVWDLVDKYGFKFGKKQETLDIMRCIPIEYVPMFNEGLKA